MMDEQSSLQMQGHDAFRDASLSPTKILTTSPILSQRR